MNKLAGEKPFRSLHCCFARPFQPHCRSGLCPSPNPSPNSRSVRALRAPTSLTGPARPLRAPTPAPSPGTSVSTQGHRSLPQRCCNRDSLRLPTGLPCPATGPTEPGPHPIPIPRQMPDAQSWGCPGAPQLLLAGWWDRPWLPGPVPCHGSPSPAAPDKTLVSAEH